MTSIYDQHDAAFREVSKDDFFAKIGPLNVNPRTQRDVTFWETPGRVILGKSTPGYMARGPKAWFLVFKGAV